jgi:hypothetical protein
MTERKFTRNLKSRGMAQQLRESVSKVIHQDLINVIKNPLELEHSNEIFFVECGLNHDIYAERTFEFINLR